MSALNALALVIESRREAGYWTQGPDWSGWGDLEGATRFNPLHPPETMPCVGVQDCRLVPLAYARRNRADRG